MKKKFIIVDLGTNKALYGVGLKTLVFSTEETADEVAKQFFHGSTYVVIEINLPLTD